MSRVAEAAIAEAHRLERNRRWREENREALAAYAREVERDGLPLARASAASERMAQVRRLAPRGRHAGHRLQTDLIGLDATRIAAPLREEGGCASLPG